MESALLSSFLDSTEANIQFGYIVPGHGFKGKQKSLMSDTDLEEMYSSYPSKRVRVWLKHVKPQKRQRSDDSSSSDCQPKRSSSAGPGFTSHLKKMTEVEEIFVELSDKHSSQYTPEQIRAWAHMIQMKKHESLEVPPKKPFFRNCKKQVSTSDRPGVSPGKRIELRSKCIDQLEKWHTLLERGAISNQEYAELHQTILGDIKKC